MTNENLHICELGRFTK